MRIGECWAALVERAQRLIRDSRPGRNARRVRLTWQTCRRCGSKSYLPAGDDRLCGSCRSLQ
jgi:ribosomal protein S27AE